MACKTLFFDFRKEEKHFFEVNKTDNLDIKFFVWSLNSETVKNLAQEDFDSAVMISVYKTSEINKEILSRFKNLRLIAVRCEDYSNIDVGYCFNNNIALINVECFEDPHSAEYILKTAFYAMSDFLCGGKSNRVV